MGLNICLEHSDAVVSWVLDKKIRVICFASRIHFSQTHSYTDTNTGDPVRVQRYLCCRLSHMRLWTRRILSNNKHTAHTIQASHPGCGVGDGRCRCYRCDLWMAETIDEYRWGDEFIRSWPAIHSHYQMETFCTLNETGDSEEEHTNTYACDFL